MEGPRDVVLQIWLEDAQRRSSGIAPGPGGVGYQLARDQGKVVHYLEFPSLEAAEQALSALGDDGQTHRGPYRTGPDGPWVIDAWDVEGTSLSRFRELAALAADRGGRYDGGEVVEGGSGVQPVPKPDESLAARQMQFQETARRGRVPGSIGTIPRAPANDSDRFA
jgi:hypothetical protein